MKQISYSSTATFQTEVELYKHKTTVMEGKGFETSNPSPPDWNMSARLLYTQ